jgi:hypothetical protein
VNVNVENTTPPVEPTWDITLTEVSKAQIRELTAMLSRVNCSKAAGDWSYKFWNHLINLHEDNNWPRMLVETGITGLLEFKVL